MKNNSLGEQSFNLIIKEIYDRPGISYKCLFQNLKIEPSPLAWYLDVLETKHLIRKQRVGPCILFFPLSIKNSNQEKNEKILDIRISMRLLDFIAEEPGINDTRLLKRLNIAPQIIHEHTNCLRNDDLISIELIKGQRTYFLSKNTPDC